MTLHQKGETVCVDDAVRASQRVASRTGPGSRRGNRETWTKGVRAPVAACDCTGITAGPPPPPAAPRTPQQGLRQQCGAAGSAVGSCSGLKVTRTCWTAEGRRDELAFGRVILGDGLGAGPLGARETNPGRAQWAPCSRFLPKEDGRDVSALR